MTKSMPKESNEGARKSTFDIAKGLGIFFLVSSHARWWPITRIFTTFFMALFFFISGYFSEKIDRKPIKEFCYSKIRRLWMPFVIGNGFFLVFHNLFAEIGITTNTYGLRDFVFVFLKILLLENKDPLLIQVWYITVLFCITFLFAGIIVILRKTKYYAYRGQILVVLGIVMYCLNFRGGTGIAIASSSIVF